MNKTRMRDVREHFSQRTEHYVTWRSPDFVNINPLRQAKVLEVGCGAKFSFNLASEKYGIDITPNLLADLKRQDKNINLVMADARYLPFLDKVFDIVGAIFVLHHLVGDTRSVSKINISDSLKEMTRVSTDQGHILILEHLSNKLFSNLFFYVTWVFSRLGLNSDILDIHNKVITFYLDDNTLKKMLNQIGLTSQVMTSQKWRFRKINLGEDKQLLIQKTTK